MWYQCTRTFLSKPHESVNKETSIEYMIVTDNEDDKTRSVIELTNQEMIMGEIDPVIHSDQSCVSLII